jgi:SAM-dependent methyltransferase
MAGAFLKPPPDPGIYTWPARQFEDLYASHPDPWGYATSWYEQRKYAITIASLPQQRFRRVFEPGCSIGVLSEHLARRADALVCADFAAGALTHARKRLARYPGVDVRQLFIPRDWPDGRFDLIVISEIATYLSDGDLTTMAERTVASLEDHGHLILVHFRPPTGTPQTADEVHRRFRDHPTLRPIGNHEESEFILDILQRQPSPGINTA